MKKYIFIAMAVAAVLVAGLWIGSLYTRTSVAEARAEEKEEARKLILQERAAWQASIESRERNLVTLQQMDSLLQMRQQQINIRIPQIKKEANEKINSVRSYNSQQLYWYFTNLR